MLLVDTNVLIDVLADDTQWADWSVAQLRAQSQVHQLAINAIVYAELSQAFSTMEALDGVIDGLDLRMLDIPRSALFLAGKAYARYRRQGGTKGSVLADFFIGAHAAVGGFPILTRDTSRYATYFSTVTLIAPGAGIPSA